MKGRSIYALMVLLLVWGGCAKETLNKPIETYQLPTDLSLTDVCFINNQEGYASVGWLYSPGILYQTNDGGQTWTVADSFEQGLHSLHQEGQELWIGQGGNALHQQNLLTDIRQTYNAQGGWWPWHDQVTLANGDVLLVGGLNFGLGYTHHYEALTDQFGPIDTFSHELRAIVQTPNGTLHAVGYGLIMRSTDQGATWEISEVQGDFFRGVSFPSDEVGYVVGEYGTVYKTTNGGASWRNCRAGNSLFANPDKLLRDIAFVDEQTGFLVGTGSVVHQTTDGGKTWRQLEDLDYKSDYQKIRIQQGRVYLLGHYGQLFWWEL